MEDVPPAATEPAATEPASSAPPAEPAEAFSLTVADLDAFEQGLRREIEMLRSAREQLRQTDDEEQQLSILGEVQPRELRREGAAAAGISEDRYVRVVSAVNDVLGKLEMSAATQQMMPSRAELEQMPAEQRARVEENLRELQGAWGDPYQGLAPETAEALQQRVDALAQLRAEQMGMLVQPR